jgi:oxaloacetate decarboxylase alpha subunit
VNAALAGTVVKVLVTVGQSVTQGQPIVVLEAMKMETDISAPAAGVVSEILVDEGDAVVVGTPLVTLG